MQKCPYDCLRTDYVTFPTTGKIDARTLEAFMANLNSTMATAA